MASRLPVQCDRRGSRPVRASVAPRTLPPFTNVRTPLRRRLPRAPPGSPHADLSPVPSATADVIDPLGRRAHSGGGGPGAVRRALMDAATPSAGAVAGGPPCGRRRTRGISQLFARHAADRGLGGGRMCSSAPSTATVELHLLSDIYGDRYIYGYMSHIPATEH